MDPFSQKLFLKIFEHHKSHFFKNTKGSRFGLLRFGLVLKSKHRFGRFEVRFPEVREVRGSVISGSFQVYSKPSVCRVGRNGSIYISFFRVRGCRGFLMQCTHPRACVTGRGWAGLCTVYYLSYVKTNYLLTAGEILFITQDALRQCPCPCSALTVHGNM